MNFESNVDAFAGLAIQGPAAAAVVNSLGYFEAPDLKPMEIRNVAVGSGQGLLVRMGFTADLLDRRIEYPARMDF